VKSEFLKWKKRKNSKMQNSAKPPSELKLDGDNAAEWSFFCAKVKHLSASDEGGKGN
jgi:hypothetical protein